MNDYKTTLDLRQAVTPDVPDGRKAVLVECPYHQGDDRPSLAVYPDGVHCFACGSNKGPLQFLAQLHGCSEIEARKHALALESAVPKRATSKQTKADASLIERIQAWHDKLLADRSLDFQRGYLYNRWIHNDTITAAMLGHTGRAYTIPIFNRAGDVVWVKYRRDDRYGTDGPKYWVHPGNRGSQIYYPQTFKHWASWNGPVVLVEGEYDALMLANHGVPALTSNNGVRSIANAFIETLGQFGGVIVAFDQDEAGRSASNALFETLMASDYPVERVRWDIRRGKDVTDVFMNGHGEKLLSELRSKYRVLAKG